MKRSFTENTNFMGRALSQVLSEIRLAKTENPAGSANIGITPILTARPRNLYNQVLIRSRGVSGPIS